MKVDYGNSPECLNDLSAEQQAVLISWIRDMLVTAERVYTPNSYITKHDFEREPEGFYVTNGMFKGALLKAGFAPVNPREVNWQFRVKPTWELCAWERRLLGIYSRFRLMRDRWRGKGYVVAMRNQCRRIVEHDAACRREQRLKLLVLRGAECAEIIMDTGPAGYRLTDTATIEIAALFDRLNPSGRNWSITNNCLAVIRRVPMHQAEAVAEKLVEIAQGCLVGARGDSGVSAVGEFPHWPVR
jgi:hypothetical protein